MDSLDRDRAFWIQFAEIWKSLADISCSSERADFLVKAAMCLQRVQVIRDKVASRPLDSPSAGFVKPHTGQPDESNHAV